MKDKELQECEVCGFIISTNSYELYHGKNCKSTVKYKKQVIKRYRAKPVSAANYEIYLLEAGLTVQDITLLIATF